MNRNYWTIYDDDSMEFERELDDEGLNGQNGDLNTMLQQILKRAKISESVDHFQQESDLFEV